MHRPTENLPPDDAARRGRNKLDPDDAAAVAGRLREWVANHDLSIVAFAEEIGVTESS